mgnify:CR=1 FL=1
MIKEANLEPLMPTIYTKLKSLGEINDVVPIQNIVSGLSNGEARAYVSNEDKNTDGVPDKIYIVYPKLNIDLQQDLLGVTTADIMAFPNLESQKMHQVSNILSSIINVLNHEQDHLKGFRTQNNIDEFSPEHSAEHAGEEAAKKFINKYNSLSKNNYRKDTKMINNLKKLSSHLKSINEKELSKELDIIIASSEEDTKDVVAETEKSLEWLNSGSDLLSAADDGAIDKYAQETEGAEIKGKIENLWETAKFYLPKVISPEKLVPYPSESARMLGLYYGAHYFREESLLKVLEESEKYFRNTNNTDRLKSLDVLPSGKLDIINRRLSNVAKPLTALLPRYQKTKRDRDSAQAKKNEWESELRAMRNQGHENMMRGEEKRLTNNTNYNLDNLFASSIMGPRK